MDRPGNLRSHIPRLCREEFIPGNIPGAELPENWGIELSGISDLTDGYRISRKNCPFSVLICTLEGRGICLHEGEEFQLGPGDIFFSGIGNHHLYRSSGRWKILWFHLDSRFRSFPDPSFFIRTNKGDPIESLYQTAETYLRESRGAMDRQILRAAGDLIFLMIQRILVPTANGQARSRDERVIDRLRREIGRDISRDWTVEDLAEVVSIAPSYLFRITGRVINQTPMALVKVMRMELAVLLLNQSDYPLKLIAERIGYSSSYSFSKAFKKFYGISPGQLRKAEDSNPSQFMSGSNGQ